MGVFRGDFLGLVWNGGGCLQCPTFSLRFTRSAGLDSVFRFRAGLTPTFSTGHPGQAARAGDSARHSGGWPSDGVYGWGRRYGPRNRKVHPECWPRSQFWVSGRFNPFEFSWPPWPGRPGVRLWTSDTIGAFRRLARRRGSTFLGGQWPIFAPPAVGGVLGKSPCALFAPRHRRI